MSSLGTWAKRCGLRHPYFPPPNAKVSVYVPFFPFEKYFRVVFNLVCLRAHMRSNMHGSHMATCCARIKGNYFQLSRICAAPTTVTHSHTFTSLRLAVQLQANKQTKQTRGALSIPQMPFFKYFPYGTGVCCERERRVHRSAPPNCCCLSNFFATFAGRGTY